MQIFTFLCIASATYVLLHQGVILGSANVTSGPETGDPLPYTCNTCCQNGMHGIPGQHGLPGSKGDSGVKGDKGEPGEASESSPGPKGSMGNAGKVGPRGPEGARGLVGPKGEKGDTSVAPRRQRSAFTVVNTQDKTVNDGDVLANWDEVITNKGNDFDKTTGKFTCRVPGTYAFMFSCIKFSGVDGPVCQLKHNDRVVVGVWVGSLDQFQQTTNGTTLDLAVADEVFVEIDHRGGTLQSNSYRYVSFSGYLLFED